MQSGQTFQLGFAADQVIKPMSLLILASASPRRAELLRAAGLEFVVRVADIDESLRPGEAPDDYVRRMASEKAATIAERENGLILAADTTVVIKDQILGKPVSQADARRMLQLLSGEWHEVLTGVCLRQGLNERVEMETTRVKFADLSAAEVDWYVATQEPSDKAGAYAIQGFASRFIERIEGSYANVVGLPVELVYRMMKFSG